MESYARKHGSEAYNGGKEGQGKEEVRVAEQDCDMCQLEVSQVEMSCRSKFHHVERGECWRVPVGLDYVRRCVMRSTAVGQLASCGSRSVRHLVIGCLSLC